MGKDKKKKKKKSRKHSSSSESDCETTKKSVVSSNSPKTPETMQRQEWMSLETTLKTQTREQWKLEKGSSRTLAKLEQRLEKEKRNEPGSHERELNVYYKNGGTGVPTALKETSKPVTSSFEDASWLIRALERAKQQAADESRTLEEVAAERWGSLETFYKLLSEAKSNEKSTPASRHLDRDKTRPDDSWRIQDKRKHDRSRSRERERQRRSRSREREGQWRRRKKSREFQSKKKKKRKPSSSCSSSSSSSSESTSSSPSESTKPSSYKRRDEKLTSSIKVQMQKPNSDEEDSHQNSYAGKCKHSSEKKNRSWRKPRSTEVNASPASAEAEMENMSTLKLEPPEPVSSPSGPPSQSSMDQLSHGNLPSEAYSDQPPTVLSDKEMNKLAAKITKAELMGNQALVSKLKAKLEAARSANKRGVVPQDDPEQNVVLLTRTDKTGYTRPVLDVKEKAKGSRAPKPQMFGPDGQRVSYFNDDFKTDLQTMFENEKNTKVSDEISELRGLATCRMEKLSDDFDVDDLFVAKVAPRGSGAKEAERDRQKAIQEHHKTQKILDSCHYCFGNKVMKKHLIVAIGKKCYLSVPAHASLSEGQCVIAPIQHVPCGTLADEDVWQEILEFRQSLVNMFSAENEDCIFFETATKLQSSHMVIHCIPMPVEIGELAPIYFKKAILECEEEWAVNKKLIDLKGRSARRAIPKGLPYFWVDFGLASGFAHVIEDERIFPKNFAQEIAGGMLESDHTLLRRPRQESFEELSKKVMDFSAKFKPFDPTLNET